ncbi:MAG TPA: hypothetical protein VN420_01325 [Candidatus Fimivivens sp.]|nr:hypothetical protein [Candidatus Fimivivens sp.]
MSNHTSAVPGWVPLYREQSFDTFDSAQPTCEIRTFSNRLMVLCGNQEIVIPNLSRCRAALFVHWMRLLEEHGVATSLARSGEGVWDYVPKDRRLPPDDFHLRSVVLDRAERSIPVRLGFRTSANGKKADCVPTRREPYVVRENFRQVSRNHPDAIEFARSVHGIIVEYTASLGLSLLHSACDLGYGRNGDFVVGACGIHEYCEQSTPAGILIREESLALSKCLADDETIEMACDETEAPCIVEVHEDIVSEMERVILDSTVKILGMSLEHFQIKVVNG